jgi:hypothetical protein
MFYDLVFIVNLILCLVLLSSQSPKIVRPIDLRHPLVPRYNVVGEVVREVVGETSGWLHKF